MICNTSMRVLFSVLVLAGLGGQVGAQTADTVNLTATVTPAGDSIKPINQGVVYSITGSYTGSPALQNSEEEPAEQVWCASASGGGADVYVYPNGPSNPQKGSSYDWQVSSSFAFGFLSSNPGKYPLSLNVSLAIAIRHKKTKERIRWASYGPASDGGRIYWAVGIGEIRASSGGIDIVNPTEIVLLYGSKCTLKAFPDPADTEWPNGKPVWRDVPRTTVGNTFDVVTTVVGSSPYTVECGNTKSVIVTVVKPWVESVDFRDGGVQTIYDVGLGPEWTITGRNYPFCVIKNQPFGIYARFNAAKNLTFPTAVQVCEHPDTISLAASTVWQNWASGEVGRSGIFFNSIAIFSVAYQWSYRVNGENEWHRCGNSTHTGYVTWDSHKCPIEDFTESHIAFTCAAAYGASTLTEIGNKLGPNICGNGRFGTDREPHGSDIFTHNLSAVWRLVDEYKKGDCGTLCTLMKAAIMLLGDNSAEVLFVYSRHNSWAGLSSALSTNNETRTGVGTELGFMNPDYNYYEGCCVFQEKWWMGGLGESKDSAYNVLIHVSSPNNNATGKRQVWHDQQGYPVSYPPGQP